MAACPAGHESTATDFCDVCGIRIDGAPAGAASPDPAASGAITPGGAAQQQQTGPAESCPQCGTSRAGQFCEVCGYDFRSGSPALSTRPADPGAPSPASAGITSPGRTTGDPAGTGSVTRPRPAAQTPAEGTATGSAWTAVVSADRAYFDGVVAAGGPDAASIQFPDYCPERRFQLSGNEMRIGRYSASRGLEPEIDLAGPPADPGISHLHAVLIAQPDGTWSVLDPGSSNGTAVNGTDLVTGVPTPLQDGDRVCLGAWTVLTIHAG
jgi:hypothetical protein